MIALTLHRYFSYLGFQFYTHSHLFLDTHGESETGSQQNATDVPGTPGSRCSGSSSTAARWRKPIRTNTISTVVSAIHDKASRVIPDEETGIAPVSRVPMARTNSLLSGTSVPSAEDIQYPRVNTPSAIILLCVITAVTYFTAENLVDSLTSLTDANPEGISKEFLSVVILPILSNGAELTTAVYAGFKGKFDLVLGVAVGSCIQITLFVIPTLVCVAWGLGKPLSLLFDPLEVSVRLS